MNSKYGKIFTNQSQQTPNNKTMREHKLYNQSAANRTFEKKRHVNKMNEQAETSPNNNAIKFKLRKELPLRHLQTSQTSSAEEMDRDYFHWGATTEIMETIRRREKKPRDKKISRKTIRNSQTGHDEKTLRSKCSFKNDQKSRGDS